MSTVETVASVASRTEARGGTILPSVALAAATAAAGLSAGLFYAYQVSATRGLAEMDDVTYVTTFQAINDRIQNPWFFAVFLGAPPLIGAALALNRRSSRAVKTLIGAGLALSVVFFAISVFGNIPLNDDLDGQRAVSAETAAAARSDFEEPWNRLNLARTLAALASFVSLTAATVVNPADRSAR
jgi:uncharacterized membrane protein